ncbi:NAD(P)-dependent oxidoreductase [Ideonella sp. DXS29W]|uniref:NAD(P)-dependent oxidoreductase n=1 Tax=Ideonella lacteola TaxID=2984193 RepID=A0ABU9BH72_9BURK
MILVTGATSGLGRNAAHLLAQSGARVRATGRDVVQGAALKRAGIPFEPVDLACADDASLSRLLDGVHTVWHCAALSSPWGRARAFDAANVRATQRLAQAAALQGVRRFVHISTPSIYFDYSHRHQVPETHRAQHLVNHYAASKWRAEEVIRGLARRHAATTFVMLRPRGLFGPHDRVVLPRILQVMGARGGRLPLPRGGQARIDLTYVENVVHAMRCATTAAVPSGSVYNITNQEPSSLAEVLGHLLRDELGLPLRIQALPYGLMDAAARVQEACARVTRREPMLTRYGVGALQFDMTLCQQRALDELGYRPVHDMADGIRRTARWWREHGAHHGL